MRLGLFCAALGFLASFAHSKTAFALEFNYPGQATLMGRDSAELGVQVLPKGPFVSGAIASKTLKSPFERSALRIDAGPSFRSHDLMLSLRDQLINANFAVVYECETDMCGGFDFRFALDLLPEPEMHVDLGDFHYLLAQRAAGAETLALVVSKSAKYGYVHITKMGDFARPEPRTGAASKSPVLQLP